MCQEGTEVTWLLSPSISTQRFCLTISSISPATGLVLTFFPGNPPLSWESFPLHSLRRIQEGRAVRLPRDGGSWPPDSEFAEGAQAGMFVPARSNVDLRRSRRGLFLSSMPRTNARPRAAAGYTSRIWQHRAFERRSLV